MSVLADGDGSAGIGESVVSRSGALHEAARRQGLWTWAGLCSLVLTFVFFRYGLSSLAAMAMAQLIFLVAPVLAATFSAGAMMVAPAGTRPHLLWTLTTTASCALLAGEVITSWRQLTTGMGAGLPLAVDVLNAIAFGSVIGMLVLMGRVERLGTLAAARLALDVLVVAVIGFVIALVAWQSGSLAATDFELAIQSSMYAIGGAVLLGLDGLIVSRLEMPARGPWVLLLNAAIAAFGLAMMVWPLWRLSVGDVRPLPTMDMITSVLFLCGYYLVFMAAVSKLTGPDPEASELASQIRPVGISWTGVILPVVVVVLVLLLGSVALSLPVGSRIRIIGVAMIALVAVCLVVRTALVDIERRRVLQRGMIDPSTGMANPRGLNARLADSVAGMRRFGSPFGVIELMVSVRSGEHAAVRVARLERALTDAAAALGATLADRGDLFSAGDGTFTVVAPAGDRPTLSALANELVATVASDPGTQGLEAWAGYAVAPDDALTAEKLLMHARTALAWTRRHGRNRVGAFDPRIGRALSAEQIQVSDADARLGVVRALLAAADARDPAHHVHSRNVAALSRVFADELELDPVRVERLALAAVLHDIGKIALDDRHATTRREREAAHRSHSEIGARIVASVGIEGLAEWVRAHHERWDGTGYPDALVAERIPFEARVIALADAYDLLTNAVTTADPLSKAAALQEIDLGMGTRFDPVLAERFIRMVGTIDAPEWHDGWMAS